MSDNNSNNNGGKTLGGGRSEPLPSSWARSNTGPRIGRIGAWSSGTSNEPTGLGMGHSDDDDDEDENHPPGAPGGGDSRETWFAGGERSGISVQNPDRPRGGPGGDLVRDLLRRAAEAGPAPLPAQAAPRSIAFTGGGHRLGSDEMESSYIPDPNAPTDQEQTIIRHLTFWQDGFTIEDGELMRYGVPENEQIIADLNEGRAPPSMLNVPPGQPVELRIAKRINEKYVPPKHTRAFQGSGNRLGAPVPSVSTASVSGSAHGSMPGSFPSSFTTTSTSTTSGSTSVGERPSVTTKFEVDQTQPTTSVQIRLADGTRMVARMNLTHTVQDIRNFINASRPENLSREYTIGTAFPNRILEDSSLTIKDAGLANSVVIQRWV